MIVVVGSVNLDLVFEVDDFPRGGETVPSTSYRVVHGGKGANQAVAAARLGANVEFVGCVGDDEAGSDLTSGLATEGVGVQAIRTVSGPTGTAVVTVDRHGENAIVVHRGANASVSPDAAADDLVRTADVVLCQQEIPMETVAAAALAAQGIFILNAAPPGAHPPDLLSAVDVLIVNEHEVRHVAGGANPQSIRRLGVGTVITTLGSSGAQVVTQADVGFVKPPGVNVRDTTGAGDTFCGAFAAAIDAGDDVFAAAARGVVAGSLATQGIGARTAMPTSEQLERTMSDMNGAHRRRNKGE